jgi:hypothetical protein
MLKQPNQLLPVENKNNLGLVGVTFSTDLSLSFVLLAEYYLRIPLKLALASLTGGDRSIGIVRLRTKTTDFFFFI